MFSENDPNDVSVHAGGRSKLERYICVHMRLEAERIELEQRQCRQSERTYVSSSQSRRDQKDSKEARTGHSESQGGLQLGSESNSEYFQKRKNSLGAKLMVFQVLPQSMLFK